MLFKIPNTEVFQNILCYFGVSFLCKYPKCMFRLPFGNWALAQSVLHSLLPLEPSRVQMKKLNSNQSLQAHWHCDQGKGDRERKNWRNKRKEAFFFLRGKRWERTQSHAGRQKAGRAPSLVRTLQNHFKITAPQWHSHSPLKSLVTSSAHTQAAKCC